MIQIAGASEDNFQPITFNVDSTSTINRKKLILKCVYYNSKAFIICACDYHWQALFTWFRIRTPCLKPTNQPEKKVRLWVPQAHC